LKIRRTTLDLLAVTLIAFACGALSVSSLFDIAHGLSIDALTALRWNLWGGRQVPASSSAVVVAIDEESYRTPPFRGSPTLTWTGATGRVLDAVLEGGSKVVGFDIVFPTSIEQSEIPFGGSVLGEKVRGFDRNFLRSLAAAASVRKVVLGEVLRGDEPIRPSPGQRIAVHQQDNIRPLNVYTDRDDIVRRLPLTFTVDGTRIPSMALELASRAVDTKPELGHDAMVALAGYQVPSLVPETMTLNFEGGAEDVPTFSFVDLVSCAARSDTEYFRRWFAGKVVLFGTVLDTEDRRLTSKRFTTGLEGFRTPRCALEGNPAKADFSRSTIAGVYIHATAVNNLIARNAVIELDRWSTFAIAALIAALVSIAGRLLQPTSSALACLAVMLLYMACATAAFHHAIAMPLVEPTASGLTALAAMIGYRLIVSDRDRRLLQRSFGLYLAPHVIERMLTSRKLPELGGETRNVTVFFSDIENFSSIAENIEPDTLVALMNKYLSAMTDIIESHGGYVDKYIGDSIVAVFGAPADDLDHAANAARAALECCVRLTELNRDSTAFNGQQLRQRIGINSGDALVGNFGSHRRYNYSVMSDAVNLASRLEGANKFYGTTIIASETTRALAGQVFAWRELDTVRVKGRAQALKIYELLAPANQLSPSREATIANYARGLAHWRAGDFAAAESCFASSADADPPSAYFLRRARECARTPGRQRDSITTLQEK
jgi:adenylate cyclase